MIKKYFGTITGAFASILLAVNIVHWDSAGFPINPTFMFPLIFIFLWFLFKVVIENEIKYFDDKILKLKNIIPLKINENILRSETAAISMISIITFNLLS